MGRQRRCHGGEQRPRRRTQALGRWAAAGGAEALVDVSWAIVEAAAADGVSEAADRLARAVSRASLVPAPDDVTIAGLWQLLLRDTGILGSALTTAEVSELTTLMEHLTGTINRLTRLIA
jgi:hypothetical protein